MNFSFSSYRLPQHIARLPPIDLISHKTRGRYENKNQYGSCQALCGKEENVSCLLLHRHFSGGWFVQSQA